MKRTKVRSKKGKAKMRKVLHEFSQGSLHSGSKRGPRVRSKAQALAIGYSEARKAEKGRKNGRRKSRY